MQDNEQSPSPTLSSAKKKHLRGLGHHLEPVVFIGKEGLSPAVIKSTEAALKAHELIKIKLGQNCPLERGQAGELLSEHLEASLVQIIGRMVLLYRPNKELKEKQRVENRAVPSARPSR